MTSVLAGLTEISQRDLGPKELGLCSAYRARVSAAQRTPRTRSRPKVAPFEIRHGPASPRSSLPSRDADVFATEPHVPRCLKPGFRIHRKNLCRLAFSVSRPVPDRHYPIARILRSHYRRGRSFGLEAVWQRLNSKGARLCSRRRLMPSLVTT
jgi:hypothetical protein